MFIEIMNVRISVECEYMDAIFVNTYVCECTCMARFNRLKMCVQFDKYDLNHLLI